MDSYCAGCVYRGRAGLRPICEYLLKTGRIRPCPPGQGCTVKKMEGDGDEMARQPSFDKARARALYDEGKSDIEISGEVGATPMAIKSWRSREGLCANRAHRPDGGTLPEVKVDIPEGLQPAVKKEPLEGFTPVRLAPAPPPDPVPDLSSAAPAPADTGSTNVEPGTTTEPVTADPSAHGADPSPEPDRPNRPAEEQVPAPAKQEGEDPVTVAIVYRGCSVRVVAGCSDQVAAAGKLLAGLSMVLDTVSNSGTNRKTKIQ